MSITLKSLLVLGIFLSLSQSYAADPAMKADAQNIDTACAADAQTAGCGNEKVGTGLMKCIHAYKKANKGFKVSEGCHAAMKQMHEDKKAGK